LNEAALVTKFYALIKFNQDQELDHLVEENAYELNGDEIVISSEDDISGFYVKPRGYNIN
jgi:hypothetical protein